MCQTTEASDKYALMLARSYGTAQVSVGILWFLLHSSRDATVHITLLMSYVVVSFYLIIIYCPIHQGRYA